MFPEVDREDAVVLRNGCTSAAAPVWRAMRERILSAVLKLSGWRRIMDTTRNAVRTAENRPA